MFCPKCGTQLDNNVRFCGGCGYRFTTAEPSASPQPSPQPVNAPPPQTTYSRPAPTPSYPQPAPRTSQQPQAAAKKTNPVAIFFVTFLVLGAVVAALMLFVYPGWLVGADDDDDDDSSSRRSKDSSSVSQVDSDSSDDKSSSSDDKDDESSQEETSATTTTSVTTSAPPEETASATTTTADILTPPDTQATTTTKASPSGGNNNDDDFTEAMNFSTNSRPTFDEFDWCYGQSDLVRSVPSGAVKLTSASSIAGGWKCMFMYSRGDSGDLLARELSNITFDVKGSSVTANIDWYLMEQPESETIPEEDFDDESFDASFSGGKLSGTFYDNAIEITEFWKENGKEYAYGEYKLEDDIYIYIALVR